jgi:hypothetical protein
MAQDSTFSTIYDSAARVHSRGVADLHDYWRSKLHGRNMPGPQDIDRNEIMPLLSGLVVASYVGDPMRVRYDLVGSTHRHYSAQDFTGRFLDELGWSEEPFVARVHETLYRTNAPVFGCYQWDFQVHLTGFSEFGFFPLSEDGETVSGSIGFDDCTEFEEQLGRAR